MGLLELTFTIILRKQGLIKPAEEQVATECLDIWTSCLAFNADLLKSVVGSDGSSTTFANLLIDSGLFGQNQKLRKQFMEAMLFICRNVKQGNSPESPALFFLDQLLKKVEYAQQFDSR